MGSLMPPSDLTQNDLESQTQGQSDFKPSYPTKEPR